MITSDGSSERSLHSRAANCTVAATSARFVFVTMKRPAILSATGSHSGSRSPQARLALLNAGPTRMANVRSICSSRTIPRLTQRVPFLFGGVRPGFFEAAVDSLLVKPRVSADFSGRAACLRDLGNRESVALGNYQRVASRRVLLELPSPCDQPFPDADRGGVGYSFARTLVRW